MLIGALAGGDQISGPVWVPSAPPSLENYLAPTLQPIPLLPAIAVLMGLLYLSGAIKLWVTGRSWSLAATASFLGGCVVIAVVMGAGLGVGMDDDRAGPELLRAAPRSRDRRRAAHARRSAALN